MFTYLLGYERRADFSRDPDSRGRAPALDERSDAQLKAELELLAAQANRLNSKVAMMREFFHAVRDEHKRACRGGDKARLECIRRGSSHAAAFESAEPLVSVIVPTLNRAQLILERTLPSVIAQDYENWELIVVGDAMESQQAALLKAISDPRVRFLNLRTRGRYPQQRGPRWYVAGVKPMNFGLRLARGAWITHLDDDDEYTDDHISALLSLARERRAEWVHGKVLFVDENGGPSEVVGDPRPALGRISRISSLYLGALKTFRYNAACWRYYYPADWDLWERFLDMGVTHAHLDMVVGVHYGSRAAPLDVYQAATAPESCAAPARRAKRPGGLALLRRWWGSEPV